MKKRAGALLMALALVMTSITPYAEEMSVETYSEPSTEISTETAVETIPEEEPQVEETPAPEEDTRVEETPAEEVYEEDSVLEETPAEEAAEEEPAADSEEPIDEDTEDSETETEEESETESEEESDPNADVETAADWEATLPSLTGVWGDDIVRVAQSQLGYTESTRNFEKVENAAAEPGSETVSNKKGYTRYGAWYGSPYEDWCAMFASFCLYYAGVPTSVMPEDSGVVSWIQSLQNYGLYADKSAGYQPVSGDLVFFAMGSQGADHVGIIENTASYYDENNNLCVTGITTIEGNSGNAVRENYYDISDARIIGYGVLAGQTGIDEETSAEWEATFPALTGEVADDVVSIAQSQIGYTESKRNFTLSSDWSKNGYTRYGAWYGSPYEDWDALFVSFCTSYAESGLTAASTAAGLLDAMKNAELYENPEEYVPSAGDVVFFTSDGSSADLTAVIERVDTEINENGEETAVSLTVIEGDSGNAVREATYGLSNVLGYGRLAGEAWDGYFDAEHPERGGIMTAEIAGDLGGTVTAEVPEGAFTEMVTLKAEAEVYAPEEADADLLSAVLAAAGKEAADNVYGLYVINIYFINGDGEEVEPEEAVSIAVDTSKAPVDVNADEADAANLEKTIFHINKETGEANAVGDVVSMNEANQVTGMAFDSEAFSPFVLLLSGDDEVQPLMDGTGSTFPVNTIYSLSVVWTTAGTGETVYSWTRDNHVTSENNSDQSTIDELASGSYRVRIDFEDLRSDQDLQVGESYVLALDWPTGDGVTVTPGATSGTIRNSSGTELATWELDPDTGEITITIITRTDDDNFYIEFTATVEKDNEPEPDGDNWVATGDVQKDGEIDELVDDTITYTITAVVPRYTESANGGKAYVWSIDDKMQSDLVYGGDYNNDMSDVEIVMTSTQYPGGIIVPSVENATEEDEYAYYVKVDSDKEDEIIFLNRCSCEETNCADWSDGCGNVYDDTGFCSCWLSIYNATFTITYSVDISEIIQGMEDHANGTAYTQIMNSAVLYDGPGSIVDNDSDAEYVYRPFTKSETTNPDRNTENKGVGSYKIEISAHDVDYSWADDIEVTDVMDNLALVEDSLTVTVGDTVLTLIDEEEAAKLDPETDHDKYYSYTYTDVTEDGEVTGGTLVIKIWYPTNQNITIEYQASVLSYNTSPTGDYSNSVTVGETGYTLNGSYQEGSSGEGGSGLTCSMTLTKVDADDNEVVLPGAVFEIYRHVEDGEDLLLDTLTTGEDGTFTFASNDDKGYWMDRDVLYYVKEIEAPEGYVLVDNLYGFVFLRNGYEGTYPDGLDPQNVIMGEPDGDQIHIEITRENTPTSVKIYKYATGDDGTKNPLEGVKFVLSKTESADEGAETTVYASFTGEEGSYVFSEWVNSLEEATTLTTGEDGYIYITYLPIGTYDLTETKAPYGYVTLEDPIKVVVSENNDSETPALVEVENEEPEPQITKEIAEDDYERKDEDIEHDDANGHFEENVDGDGWGTWDDADNNQEVTYHLKLTDIKDAVNLTVHDYLEDGLDFEPETVEISLFDPDETELTEGTDYTMTQGACSDPECAMDGCTFEVKFADSVFTDISSDAYLMITYKALTDTHEEDYDDYVDEILNHSYMTYGVNVNALRRSGIVTTATDLFGFGVYKYAGEDDEEIALAGAEFVLERGGVYATFDTETDSDTGEVYYMIYGWVEDIELAAVLTSDADGMIRIEGLDDDTYTVTETKAPEGYEIVDEAITVVIDEDGNVTVNGDTGSKEAVVGHVVNVENTPVPETPVTEVPVTKVWDDSSNVDQLRPGNITVKLLADGEDAGEALTLSDSNNWKGTFTDLPVYDADGKEIAYTVEEVSVEGYTSDIAGNAGTGFVITNTHTPAPEEAAVSVTGGKTWDDEADADGIRPDSIIIRVLANGEEVRSAEVTEEDNWEWSFENLPKYDEDGKEIVYTITEDPVDGYDSTVEGYNVTNTHAPETPENPTKSVNVGNGTTVLVGDELTYTITYYNHHSDAETVTIVDMLDTGLEFVSASDNGTYDAATHTVTWVIENAPARTKGKVTVDVKVTEAALTNGSVENDAAVQIGNDAAVSTNHVDNPVTETGTIPGVKTGDDTPIGTVAAVMAAALALLIVGFAYRRRRVSR